MLMRSNEVRQQSGEELNKELDALFREQFNLRMQKSLGQASRHHQFSRIRKDIARIKTILNERKRVGDGE
jgi:large subunit ribosomal protein L29